MNKCIFDVSIAYVYFFAIYENAHFLYSKSKFYFVIKELFVMKHEASIAIQVLPKVEDEKVFEVVDKVIEYIKSTGLKYMVSPFETTVEGDLDTLMDIVKKSQLICIENGANRVSSYVKISYNPQGVWTIDEKVGKYEK